MKAVGRKIGVIYGFAIILVSLQWGLCKETSGLYDENDVVIILNGLNFRETVFGCDSAWIIEFYNTWCGHCQHFAPTWKAFAKTHLENGWSPVIKVAALDCANSDNRKICTEFGVEQFPIFKLIPPLTPASEHVGVWSHVQEPELITNGMVDFLSNSSLVTPPQSWPNLTPLESMQDIWDDTRDEHHHIALVFESPGSYVGREVILDTFRYKNLIVRRMLRNSVKKYGITAFPSLYLMNRDGTFKRLAKDNNTREGMVGALKGLLTSDQLEAGNQIVMESRPKKERKPAKDRQEVMPGVYMTDLESTLHYSFRQEVAIHRTIDNDKLFALRQFLKVLVKYFPGRSEVMGYLQKLSAWLAKTGSELSGDQWSNAVEELQTVDQYLPDRIEWVGCHGSESRYRGYPCGMWTLFHTLTVGAYQAQRKNPRDLPVDVLSAVQGYMKYFFGCETCVQHFLKMASTITTADKDSQHAVLWLWKAHNKANKRLKGDVSEDPRHKKIQFPSKTVCPKCYNGNTFDEDGVFKFLVSFYGSEGIIESKDSDEVGLDGNALKFIAEDSNLDWWELQQRKKDLEKIRKLRHDKKEKNKLQREKRKHGLALRDNKDFGKFDDAANGGLNLQGKPRNSIIYGWGFSNFDMGMCVVFYLLCTVIILLLYYHFIVRRKYKPFSFL